MRRAIPSDPRNFEVFDASPDDSTEWQDDQLRRVGARREVVYWPGVKRYGQRRRQVVVGVGAGATTGAMRSPVALKTFPTHRGVVDRIPESLAVPLDIDVPETFEIDEHLRPFLVDSHCPRLP